VGVRGRDDQVDAVGGGPGADLRAGEALEEDAGGARRPADQPFQPLAPGDVDVGRRRDERPVDLVEQERVRGHVHDAEPAHVSAERLGPLHGRRAGGRGVDAAGDVPEKRIA
jgi:hypothetical protein